MNDSSNNTSFNSQDLEGSINLKAIFGKIMAHLPYFVLSIVFALFIAFLVNRYADPKYKVTTTLLIKEKNARTGGMDGAESFLSGMSLLNSSRNIENEQGVLKSKSLVE